MLLDKIVKELEELPEHQLAQFYEIVRDFRTQIETESRQPRTPGLLVGTLGDAFFDPLPEEELKQWE